MSVRLSPNIPTNVVEIGQEITQGVVDALNNASAPSATNPYLTGTAGSAYYLEKAGGGTVVGTIVVDTDGTVGGNVTTINGTSVEVDNFGVGVIQIDPVLGVTFPDNTSQGTAAIFYDQSLNTTDSVEFLSGGIELKGDFDGQNVVRVDDAFTPGSQETKVRPGLVRVTSGSASMVIDYTGISFPDSTVQSTAFAVNTGYTFTASQVISVTDNTNAALRVTQLGTGEAFRVEDSANPDNTPFVINADGRVNIGSTSASTYKVSISGGSNSLTTSGIVYINNTQANDYALVVNNQNSNEGILIENGSFEMYTASPFIVTGDGLVGIGTNNPTTKLEVVGTSIFRDNSGAGSSAVRITQTGTGEAFRVEDSATPDTTPFVITADGRVGIQTTTVGTNALTVSGNTAVTGTVAVTGGVTTTAANTFTVASGTAVPLTIQNNGTGNSFVVNDEPSDTSSFVIDAAGNVGIGRAPTTRKVEVLGSAAITGQTNLSTTSGNISVLLVESHASNTADCVIITHAGTGASFRVNDVASDTTPFIVDAGGNVGVKTASPSTDFEVNGNAKATTVTIGSSASVSSIAQNATDPGLVGTQTYTQEIWINIGGTVYKLPARV